MLVPFLGREKGMRGVAKADLTTHFYRKKFNGTEDDLAKQVERIQDGRLLTFVSNAEDAIVKALK